MYRWRHRALPRAERGWIVFARSTTIHAQPTAIEAGIAHVRDEVMPAVEGMPGCIGLSLLVDRGSGRCIVTTAWETEQAMRDSAVKVRPIRERAAEAFRGNAEVEEWEIAVLHRDHRSREGACVRAVWVEGDPNKADMAIETYKTRALPGMEQLEGFCSASLMVHRASGRGVSCTTFDSSDAMDRNRQQAAEIREANTKHMGLRVTEVAEFELALAHLRVPELV
ncbi:Antibiotic biosynthesis monooxygenase [Nocardia amikacinitolerans]|uniref:Antibiotic biosynthesis monooxygenase n=1 Tax=Nocardia amikacinitolerans TaxID=756689 RepID=A0A285LQF1_9NOCA|nr:Antibiotic biosynthesis monooxygenase [Nocardia amikacinitolerans]MCP2294708.1 Antibiotic biosynthesis monooxygenase [Nocardia amikacinitolerans]SNY87135.1 Antibiotic biosynthesis monooxygenase [Nocardia amikacinitolerans]